MKLTMRKQFLLASCVLVVLSTAAFVEGQTAGFSDDFERPDGPATGWTPFSGQWDVVDGRLTQNAAAGWVWADDPAAYFRGDLNANFLIEFSANIPADGVGRHGGVMFFAGDATSRDNSITGYTLDWIDRDSDHGLRLIRWDGAAGPVILVGGTFEIAEPPEFWEIAVEGDEIIVSGDGEIAIEVVDDTYREGFFGLWAYSNGTDYLIDDLFVESDERASVVPCISAAPLTGPAPHEVDFDAGCSSGDIVSYAWDFGDGTEGEGAMVSHTFEFADVYTVTLRVSDAEGNTESRTLTVDVSPAVDIETEFFADFEEGGGPPDDWKINTGLWEVVDGRLTAFSTGEDWIWVGDPEYVFAGDLEISFEYEFLLRPGDDIGRHGGVMLFSSFADGAAATDRYAASGYLIDWIDRASDHGLRVIRYANGTPTVLQNGTPAVPEPPSEWKIVVSGEFIRVFGDGALLADIRDATYRSGSLAFWMYSNGQEVAIDNVAIVPPLGECQTTACFDAEPSIGSAPLMVTFDASCTSSLQEIAAYEWDFGDGSASEPGASVTHEFVEPGSYTVTVTAMDACGETLSVSQDVLVTGEAACFADTFDRDDGPADGWTAHQGEWIIESERLTTLAFAQESWVWAGAPPVALPEEFEASFELAFPEIPAGDVGRHGGVLFCASVPTLRGDSRMNGYLLDWIDRASDHGLRLHRLDGGVEVPLAVGTPEIAEPPLNWSIVVESDTILVLDEDGAPIIEVLDNTYRGGFFAFWAYSNSSSIAVDEFSLAPPGEECSGPSPAGSFRRGDVDGNGVLEVTDPVNNLAFQFLGSFAPTCLDALDWDDNGVIDLTDPIANLSRQFLGGAPAAPPGSEACGVDPTEDTLTCEGSPSCVQ